VEDDFGGCVSYLFGWYGHSSVWCCCCVVLLKFVSLNQVRCSRVHSTSFPDIGCSTRFESWSPIRPSWSEKILWSRSALTGFCRLSVILHCTHLHLTAHTCTAAPPSSLLSAAKHAPHTYAHLHLHLLLLLLHTHTQHRPYTHLPNHQQYTHELINSKPLSATQPPPVHPCLAATLGSLALKMKRGDIERLARVFSIPVQCKHPPFLSAFTMGADPEVRRFAAARTLPSPVEWSAAPSRWRRRRGRSDIQWCDPVCGRGQAV
jgi:hypothetical protein